MAHLNTCSFFGQYLCLLSVLNCTNDTSTCFLFLYCHIITCGQMKGHHSVYFLRQHLYCVTQHERSSCHVWCDPDPLSPYQNSEVVNLKWQPVYRRWIGHTPVVWPGPRELTSGAVSLSALSLSAVILTFSKVLLFVPHLAHRCGVWGDVPTFLPAQSWHRANTNHIPHLNKTVVCLISSNVPLKQCHSEHLCEGFIDVMS